jgi:hypothetical protein
MSFHVEKIDESITDELILILNRLRIHNNGVEFNSTYTRQGFQSNNLCFEPSMQPLLNLILKYFPDHNKYKYRWFQLIDYFNAGWQEGHDHSKTDNLSFILYLTSCQNGGETIFEFENTKFVVKPEKNKIVFFPATIWHWGEVTIDHKKVAVGALLNK